MNLREIQREQVEWVAKNFGTRPSWQPFVGMVEEIGELEAAAWQKPDDIYDAIGDIVIFMSDFCTLEGVDLLQLYEESQDFVVNGQDWSISITSCLAWVARGFLKKAQGVRGTPEENQLKMREGLRGVLAHLDLTLVRYRRTLPEVVTEVWLEVRKRDWKLYPATGLPATQEPLGRVTEPAPPSGSFRGEDVT